MGERGRREDQDSARRDVKSRAVATRVTAVPVRLTLGERDQLADTARDLGISISTYIRQIVLSRPLPPRRAVRPIPEVNRETYPSGDTSNPATRGQVKSGHHGAGRDR